MDDAAMARQGDLLAAVRAAMKRDRLSVRALARRLGVHHTTLSRLLAGRTAPGPRLRDALVAYMGGGGDTETGPPAHAAPRAADLPVWALPEGVGPDAFQAALERLVAMAGGSEVEGLVRAGYGPKRDLVGRSGMAGPVLARLDALYDLYCGRAGVALPPALARRVAGALLYFVLSVDEIPDDLFPFGYLDDAWVADLVWREVQAFRRAGWHADDAPGPSGAP